MRKIMSLMLGLSLVTGAASYLFAQDRGDDTKKDEKRKKKKKDGDAPLPTRRRANSSYILSESSPRGLVSAPI